MVVGLLLALNGAICASLSTSLAKTTRFGSDDLAHELYSAKIIQYPALPVLDYMQNTSAWQFAYNPAYLPGKGVQGLFVRVQNGSTTLPGTCGRPTPPSFVAFSRLNDTGGAMPLGERKVFSPALTDFEQTAEDPRIIYDASNQTWIMTYTANGAVKSNSTKPPMNRHQGIASSRDPLTPGSWTRHCTAVAPCLPPGLKSGAMLQRDSPPHYMFVYDLTLNCPSNPGSVCRHTVVAESQDLLSWHLPAGNNVLLPRRQGMWDAGLIEPGPPPLRLQSGDYIFFYNGATMPNDRQYHVGFAILSGENPTHVLQRSASPVLSWTDRPWMVGNSSAYLCYTPSVVFCNGARHVEGKVDTFELFFGGADAVVGSATVALLPNRV